MNLSEGVRVTEQGKEHELVTAKENKYFRVSDSSH